MNKSIHLNKYVSINLPKLIESRLLVQANSGGGKSWAIRRIIEQSFGAVQIIVIDPEGEFGNMRSKFDFVYVGKGGDAPAESRSAALLARRLLELKASAIIDLYELPPQERKHFVRLFCEALVNAPKELWHDALIIIDEAHVFAPEKGESEALGPVIDLATRGRKRGYCVVLATQRLPKLNKDAAAECNNKLIGRASQDIDRKRASEELGFTTKEQILSLRDLDPGEFYVFGPAISRDVIRTVIDDVAVKPPKRGVSRSAVPAPSAHVKQMLAKLADLPQEAVEEAKTIQELKAALIRTKKELVTEQERKVNLGKTIIDLDVIDKAVFNAEKKMLDTYNKQGARMTDEINKFIKVLKQIHKIIEPFLADDGLAIYSATTHPKILENMERRPYTNDFYSKSPASFETTKVGINPSKEDRSENKSLGRGELLVLNALAQHQNDGLPREGLTTITGYKRSTRDAYILRLQNKGYIRAALGKLFITDAGIEQLGPNYVPVPTSGLELRNYLFQTLPKGEKDVLSVLLNEPGGFTTREHITNETGFSRSTRDAYILRLKNRQLVEVSDEGVRVVERLLD